MAGPTPVSALIHAATMVTAGVYLIARTHVIFELAPTVQLLVAVIGAVTLLVAGFSALTQRDIKRVLAYSTISQIGYMFLALGVGAYSAAMFHFMTHAFFKSLLFLSAGVVILAMRHEHDMFKMGGLARRMPLVFWTFLIGACSLSALPFVTAGFYSKDLIIQSALVSPAGGVWLWAAGLAGALLTAAYTFRMVFVTFFGEMKLAPARQAGGRMGAALVVLAGLALVAGCVEMPDILGNVPHLFSGFVQSALPPLVALPSAISEWSLMLCSIAASVIGIFVAYVFYLARPEWAARVAQSPVANVVRRFWLAGWGFDWVYDRVFVRPVMWLARVNRADVLDLPYRGVAEAAGLLHRALARTQTGMVRWYAASLAIGAIVIIAWVVLT
jgi:NADH-quinone oxidoreductase subunit L